MTKVICNSHTAGQKQMKELNDCTVRAVMSACNIDYLGAHQAACLAGRGYRKGFWSEYILKQLQLDGIIKSWTKSIMYDHDRYKSGAPWTSPYPTLTQCLPLLQSGRYVVETANHAMAVVDGVVYDGGTRLKSRSRINNIFEVTL